MRTSLLQRLDHWIANEYRLPAGALGLFRIFYSGYILFVVGAPQFRWIARQPALFFDPPTYSLAKLIGFIPSFYFFLTIDLTIVGLLGLLLFGFRTRLTSLLLGFIMLLGFSFYYSFGKINHDTITMVITPLLMAFSGWGSYYSIDGARGQPNSSPEIYWPVITLTLIIGFGMFSAGLPKLIEHGSIRDGWLNMHTQAVKGYAIIHHHSDLASNFLAPVLLKYGEPFIWEFLDYVAVIFEIGFLFAAARKKWFQFFILITVFFHLMNGLLLSISFTNNIALYLLFVNWAPLVVWFDKVSPKHIRFSAMILLTSGLMVAYAFYIPVNLTALLSQLGLTDLSSSLFVVVAACFYFGLNFLYGLRHQQFKVGP
ncbi:MAG: hypothetical protein WA960_17385 [Tunicatimonas sp.]